MGQSPSRPGHPQGMNGSQLRHDLCLVHKGKSPQKNQLHFIFAIFVLHLKLTALQENYSEGNFGCK